MNRPIGVFDSGIGGLSVLKALRTELPKEGFIYIADSGHAPYGERDDTHVQSRSLAIAAYLASQNVKALVMACNTATAAAIALLRAEYPGLPIIGIEPALKPAALLSQTGYIGVLATRSTLASASFQALLAAQTGQACFTLQACDGLAAAIEHSAATGDTSKTIALCAHYTRAMGLFGPQARQIDTLVLGCTHYPFASQHLHALLGPEVQIVNNVEAVARQTRRRLQAALADASQPAGELQLLSTNPPHTLQTAASRWLGVSATAHKLRL